MLAGPDELLDLLAAVFVGEPPPKPLNLLWAAALVKRGDVDVAGAANRAGTKTSRLTTLLASDSDDILMESLGGALPLPDAQVTARARQSLGQLTIGNLAERIFEEIYRDTVSTTDLELRDDRGSRGETDYLVFNGQGRQVFRINIKFHGALFRRAVELVGLIPEDCFALATYKIYAALNKQDTEHLPYIFVIVGVPGLTGSQVGEFIPEDLVHLATLPRLAARVRGVRQIEDRIVEAVTGAPARFRLESAIESYAEQIRGASWFVLSARRAERLLREKLFERVYALRVRSFARNYRAAELDMHFSLSQDLTPLADFLAVLRDYGMPGLVSRLERGTL